MTNAQETGIGKMFHLSLDFLRFAVAADIGERVRHVRFPPKRTCSWVSVWRTLWSLPCAVAARTRTKAVSLPKLMLVVLSSWARSYGVSLKMISRVK